MFEPPAEKSTLKMKWKSSKQLRVAEGELVQCVLRVKNTGKGMTMLTAVVGERRRNKA